MIKKRIAIIEDNPVIREGFAGLINASNDFEVCGAYGAAEPALKALDEDSPDLVLMDIGLPGMSGIESTALIKKRRPACIVLIITVLEDSDKVFRSLCAGAGGYIIKNADNETIVKSITEAFQGGAPMSLSIAKMVVTSFSRSPGSPLSERETEVLRGVAAGKSYSRIALDLFISKETVRSHIKNIYQKLAVNNKAGALKVAGDKNWIH